MKYNKGMPLYAVFPLLYREDVLSEAWKRVKANKALILRKWKKRQKVDLEGQQQP